MGENNLKERIIEKAVELFSSNGYYGTTIREIAKAAGCSLPMLYYYFNNKNDLYEEIVYGEFMRINARLMNELPIHLDLKEIYIEYVLLRKRLSNYEKSIYKMALKVWMGIEGNIEIQNKFKEWELSRIEKTKGLLNKYGGDSEFNDVLGNIFVRVLENMVNKIVLMNEDITDEEVKKEINLIFNTISNR